jgi:dTDP-4-dehydrorhamnose reductase
MTHSWPERPTKPTAIVFGTGLVGTEMAKALARDYAVRSVGREECDVSDWDALCRWEVAQLKPMSYSREPQWAADVVVNATGYTNVDKADEEPELAYRVNGLGAENLARTIYPHRVLVHISSDAVFGRYAQSYDELDQPWPISVYARTKLAGEALVERVGCKHLLIRTGNLYGAAGKNHASALARPLTERTLVDCERAVAPTPGWLVAETVRDLLAARQHGIYHVMTTGRTSWHDFARKAQEWQAQPEGRIERRTGKYGRAPRPPYGLLHSVLLPLRGITMPRWQDALHRHLSITCADWDEARWARASRGEK